MYVNQVELIGFTGKDAQSRTTGKGIPVTSFMIATGKRWKDPSTHELQQRTEWHRCVAYGPLGEFAATLSKGSYVRVVGELRNRSYERDIVVGTKTFKVSSSMSEIVVDEILKLERTPKEAKTAESDHPHDPER
jgi:single-strand DNA-binding protein